MEPWSTKEKKNKKAWFRDNYFHFQIFETFGNLEIDFSINISKSLWNVDINFVVILFSC